MKGPRKRVPYRKPGKRNPILDISTDAGRRARNRAADKKAEQRLREAVGNPMDEKGHPVPGHLLKTIASVRLHRVEGSSPISIFDELMRCFLDPLRYSWGTTFSVAQLWNAFLELVTSVDTEIAQEFARKYFPAFRWCVAGHIHLLDREYASRPDAIIGVEIWTGKAGRISVAVRRNGEKFTIPPDYAPENPRIVFAGTRVHEFLAPQDWTRLHRIGHKRFLAELKSGKANLSPKPFALVTEDTLFNVRWLTKIDLKKVRMEMPKVLAELDYKPKRMPPEGP